MDAAISNVKNNGNFSLHKFSETASRYVDLLRRHIDKENAIIFPMAEKYLSS